MPCTSARSERTGALEAAACAHDHRLGGDLALERARDLDLRAVGDLADDEGALADDDMTVVVRHDGLRWGALLGLSLAAQADQACPNRATASSARQLAVLRQPRPAQP